MPVSSLTRRPHEKSTSMMARLRCPSHLDRLLEHVYFLYRQYFGQTAARLGRLKQFGRIVGPVTVEHQIAEERPHTAQYPALRCRAYADSVKSHSEILKVLQLHVHHRLVFLFQIVCQFLYVAPVGIECVWRVVAFQFQITHVFEHHIRIVFLVHVPKICYFCRL